MFKQCQTHNEITKVKKMHASKQKVQKEHVFFGQKKIKSINKKKGYQLSKIINENETPWFGEKYLKSIRHKITRQNLPTKLVCRCI